MLFACIITNILAIALPSLRISPLLLIRIATIILLYTAALYGIYLSVVYIQPIGSGIGVFSGLFNNFFLEILSSQLLVSSLLPIKPADVIPTRRLTSLERQQFTLPSDLKAILVGLLLGDLYASKKKFSLNPTFKFTQGMIHKEYLMHFYNLFQNTTTTLWYSYFHPILNWVPFPR